MALDLASVNPPVRFPLLVQPENRDSSTSKDSRLVNGYAEKVGESEYWIYKRAGTLVSTTNTGAGRGCYNWLGDIYEVFGTTLYKNGVSLGTVDGTAGVYRFDSTLGATPTLVLGNGVKAYTYNTSAGFLTITDGDFPTAFVKGWAFLDGTLYVMDLNSGIHGSDLNAPNAWDALNKIVAQIEPDKGVALAKQLVYVIALKQWTTEVFYDAANATGSPLGAVQGAKVNYGCLSADSVQNVDDVLVWISTNRQSVPQVVRMEKLTAQVVSTKAIDRLLKGWDYTNIQSWQFAEEGHRFYVITSVVSNMTLVYDIDEGLWYQWFDTDGNYMPISSSTFNSSRQHLWQHISNGKTYLADRSYTNDDTALFTVDLYTPNFDAGTRNKKTVSMLEVVGDQTQGSIIQIRCSDDDYQSWTNFRSVDMSKKHPRLTDCGTFSQRAMNLRHRCNTRMRIKATELRLLLGTA